jgi:hypothetical protein
LNEVQSLLASERIEKMKDFEVLNQRIFDSAEENGRFQAHSEELQRQLEELRREVTWGADKGEKFEEL